MKFYRKPSGLVMLVINDSQLFGGRFYYSTGENVAKSDWKKNRAKEGRSDLNALNDYLTYIETTAKAYIRSNRNKLTKEGLRDHLDKELRPKDIVVEKRRTLLDEWEDYLVAVKGTVTERTFWGYRNTKEAFEKFLKDKKLTGMTPEEFGYRQYQAFQVWLKTVPITSRKGKFMREGYLPNTVAKRLKHFKMFVNYLEKMRVKIDLNPGDIKFKETSGVKIHLTKEELDLLEKLPLIGHIAKARDLFLLQCLTGLRVSDLFRLDQNIQGDKIVIETKKVVGNTVTQPITPRVRAVLERYNYRLPSMTEQNYREYIKEIYKKINPTGTIQVRVGDKFENRYIYQEISSHDAVRTFVTLLSEQGVPIPSIAKLVGKSVSVLIKNYLVVAQKTAEKELIEAFGKVG